MASWIAVIQDLGSGPFPKGTRSLHQKGKSIHWKSYLGAEDYHFENGKLHVPRGRYVLLSACRKNEWATEKILNGKSRGVFTFCLLKALSKGKRNWSLHSLYTKTKAHVRQLSRQQNPQIESSHPSDLYRSISGDFITNHKLRFLVYFDRKKGWIIELGFLHGFRKISNPDYTINLFTDDFSNKLLRTSKVEEVFFDHTTINGMEGMDINRQYSANLSKHLLPNWKLFAADFMEQKNWLFAKNWHFLKQFSNTDSGIKPTELSIEFYKVLESAVGFQRVLNEQKQDLSRPILLHYGCRLNSEDDKWECEVPRFRLKIGNPENNNRKLWYSLLFLGANYSISNELLPLADLAPGQSLWIERNTPNSKFPSTLIPMHIDSLYLQQGIDEIEEYFKLIISTEEFDTNSLNQMAYPLNEPEATRATKNERPHLDLSTNDWIVFDFSVKVIHKHYSAETYPTEVS